VRGQLLNRLADVYDAQHLNDAVQVEVLVNELGAVSDARVVRSIPLLDESALDAVRTWRFEPTVVNGRAVPIRMNVTVNFAP
jgi:protein TonB